MSSQSRRWDVRPADRGRGRDCGAGVGRESRAAGAGALQSRYGRRCGPGALRCVERLGVKRGRRRCWTRSGLRCGLGRAGCGPGQGAVRGDPGTAGAGTGQQGGAALHWPGAGGGVVPGVSSRQLCSSPQSRTWRTAISARSSRMLLQVTHPALHSATRALVAFIRAFPRGPWLVFLWALGKLPRISTSFYLGLRTEATPGDTTSLFLDYWRSCLEAAGGAGRGSRAFCFWAWYGNDPPGLAGAERAGESAGGA